MAKSRRLNRSFAQWCSRRDLTFVHVAIPDVSPAALRGYPVLDTDIVSTEELPESIQHLLP